MTDLAKNPIDQALLELATEIGEVQVERRDLEILENFARANHEADAMIDKINYALTREIDTLKANAAAMIGQQERRKKAMDYVYGKEARETVRAQLTGKAKSITTLWGRLGFRKKAARTVAHIEDKDAAAAYLFEHNYRQALKLVPMQSEVNKIVAEGEVIPGVEIEQVPETEEFYCKDVAPRALPTETKQIGADENE